jgi:DNA invertase Pin-like site-specific DNA recombinase
MLFGYTRYSTVAQGDGSTIEDQKNKIRGCAMMRGALGDLTMYEDRAVSGSTPLAKRPAGAKLLAEIQSGDLIIASKCDRLFRSASDALVTVESLKKRGIGVILVDCGNDPVTENGTSKLFFSLLASFAEWERVRIAERMSDGRRGKKEKGGHAGGSAPFGYRIVGHGREAVLVPDEDEQQAVQLMKQMRDDGKSYFSIMTALSERGFRSRKGTQLGPAQILRIVRRAPQQQAAE